MKKSGKKYLSLCLSASLILSMLGACSSATTDNPEGGDATGNQGFLDSERVTINYWDVFSETMLPDSYAETLIEDKFPVDIVVNRSDVNNMIQVSALMQEGKVPDVFWTSESAEYIASLDLTRTIPREMVEEYAPSFLDLYDTYPTIYTSIMDLDNSEEFFALNGATDQMAGVACSLYADFYRYDWIQALDIDLGVEVTQISDNFYVAHNGLTLDKFEEVMEAFTYGDPDGNGEDDTYGASFEGMDRFDLLYSGFGFTNGINEENGTAQKDYATVGFQEFSIWFSDLYDKGYIDEDFFYQTRNARWEKVNQGQVGYFLESSIAINSWALGRPPLSVLVENPDVTFLVTPGLSDNEGQGTIIKSELPTYGRLCYISKDVDDEKLALILQVMEYISFGEDKITMWFGEEGVDWKYDSNNKVENINFLPTGEKGARFFVQNVQTDELFEAINVEETFAAGAEFWLYDCIWRENDREQYQFKLDLYNETNFGELENQYGGDCYALSLQYFEDWVYNGLDVKSSWSDYLQDLDDAGYNLMMSELDQVEPLDVMIQHFSID